MKTTVLRNISNRRGDWMELVKIEDDHDLRFIVQGVEQGVEQGQRHKKEYRSKRSARENYNFAVQNYFAAVGGICAD